MSDLSPALLQGLRREQVIVLCRVMSKAPLANLITVGFICYIVWDYVPPWAVFVWAGAVFTSELVRAAYARRTLAAVPGDASRALSNLVWIALLVGCARGSAMPLFFASLPPVGYAALSAIFLGFCAGGLSTHGAYARAFYAFATPMLLPMGIAWLGLGSKEGVLLAILFAVFALIIAEFAREIEKLVRDSFVIRHERDELVGQLERERQEVALARDEAEQANRAKSRFLAAASHDLRQPLHALSLFAAALTLRNMDPDVREISINMGQALRSLSALVDALLDVSRLDAGAMRPELQPVDADAIVQRIAAEYRAGAERKGIELKVERCGAVVVQTDPLLFNRMLRNLVDNAIKYTQQGSVSISLRVEGSSLRVTVADTGEGIPAGEREQIFEEFYQIGNSERDRSKGLGLGLAIVRRIGKLLGTEIEMTSEVGQGSAFAFRLPVSGSVSVAGAAVARQAADGSLKGRGVLVIDDEPDVRVGMRTLLETWGCRVAACSGLDEARLLLDRHELKFDLIVADLRLRANESGIETVKALLQRVGQIPALLVSGDTAPERIKEAEASGFRLLHKPVPPDALRTAMLASIGHAAAS